VTLTGTVGNLQAKRRAERIAETVKGVRAVVNDIVVSPVRAVSAEALEEDVKNALLRNQATEGYELMVQASDTGLVTLSGEVDSWAESQLAEKVAASVNGVTGIENEVLVEYDTTRADPEIREEVIQRLRWSTLVRSGLVDVEVRDAEVYLSGTIGSAAEKRMAETLAWVTGVNGVDSSGLEVEEWARNPDMRARPAEVTDATIENAVRDALLYDPRVNSANVEVDVNGGIVTLRGVVDNLSARRSAAETTRNVTGVLTVNNRLKTRLSDDGMINDGALESAVEAALISDSLVDVSNIDVVVYGGEVRLYGHVDSYYEKVRAEDAASQVTGVVSVENNLSVTDPRRPYAYDPYIDAWPDAAYPWYDYQPYQSTARDSEIREAVESQLWWSPFVDSDDVTVTVSNGTVTLTGTVNSVSEYRAAVENAYEGGAVWVDNDLHIDFQST
jgi:osmotically-inducible protein OsmY